LWVFGIVDTTFTPARGYVELVDRRNAETLLPIISKVCRPHTIIHSDEWPAYKNIKDIGFEHSQVNHSYTFVNRKNGVHTQNIESYWNKIK
jgi:hypothetical protein